MLLINKNDKIYDILKFINEPFSSDIVDEILYLQLKYEYFKINKLGEILIVQENKNIKVNLTLINKYHFNEIDVKRKFITDIRKRKLNDLKI